MGRFIVLATFLFWGAFMAVFTIIEPRDALRSALSRAMEVAREVASEIDPEATPEVREIGVVIPEEPTPVPTKAASTLVSNQVNRPCNYPFEVYDPEFQNQPIVSDAGDLYFRVSEDRLIIDGIFEADHQLLTFDLPCSAQRDFDFKTDFGIISNPSGKPVRMMITFRDQFGVNGQSKYYMAILSSEGHFAIFYHDPASGKFTQLVQQDTPYLVIGEGESAAIRLVSQADKLVVQVDGVNLTTVTLSEHAQAGMFKMGFDGQVGQEAIFFIDNFSVTSAD